MRFSMIKNQLILDNGCETCYIYTKNIHITLSEIPVKDCGLSLPNIIFCLHPNVEIYRA